MSAAVPAGGVRVELDRDAPAWWRDPWAVGVTIVAALTVAVWPWSPGVSAVLGVFAVSGVGVWGHDRWMRIVVTPSELRRRGVTGTRTLSAASVRRITLVDDEVRPDSLVVVGPGLRSIAVPLHTVTGPAQQAVLRSFVASAVASGAEVDADALTALAPVIVRS